MVQESRNISISMPRTTGKIVSFEHLYSSLDLASGFHQMEIESKDIQKTEFKVENGHFEFVRMPFGLRIRHFKEY